MTPCFLRCSTCCHPMGNLLTGVVLSVLLIVLAEWFIWKCGHRRLRAHRAEKLTLVETTE